MANAATTPYYYRGHWHDNYGDHLTIFRHTARISNNAGVHIMHVHRLHGTFYKYTLTHGSSLQPIPLGYKYGHLYASLGVGAVKLYR